jgi:hypothetical protein
MSQAGSASSSGGGGGTGILTLNYTLVTTTPYVVQATDSFMGVNTAIAITIQLPNAPVTGRVYMVKDIAGLAAINNITVTTVGGTVLIENAATFVMNSSFEAIQLLFNGTKYLVF